LPSVSGSDTQTTLTRMSPAELTQPDAFADIFNDRYDLPLLAPLEQPLGGSMPFAADRLPAANVNTEESRIIETIMPREKIMYLVTMFFEFVSDPTSGSRLMI
jgi:hypothetical protein